METKTLGLLTVLQAADYLNIPRPTLYQHLREGRIPGIQIGGRWRIETKILQRFLGIAIDDEQIESASNDRTTTTHRCASIPLDEEIEKLQTENRHLRSISAQQLLELHEPDADKDTPVFRQETNQIE